MHAKLHAEAVAAVARIGLGEDRNAMSAFLFTFPGGDTSAPAEKLPKASNCVILPLCQNDSAFLELSRSLPGPLHLCTAGRGC